MERRVMDMEVAALKAGQHDTAQKLESLLVGHTRVESVVSGMRETLDEVRAAVVAIPGLDRRVQVLERLVFGAVSLILVAVIGAWVFMVVQRPAVIPTALIGRP